MVQPNLVLIVADQLNYGFLGCMGNAVVRTPNIDRHAAKGVVFDNAYCQAPICMPSRSSFNTGLYPHAARARHNPIELPPDATTLAERLAAFGYDTAAFGHIGGDGVERGFRTKVDFFDQPLRRVYMAEQEHILSGDELLAAGTCGIHPLPLDEQFDSLATQAAVDYLGNVAGPFYLQLDFMRPHIPWFVADRYASMYDPSLIPLPATCGDELEDKPSNVRATRIATLMEPLDEASLRQSLRHYYALITFVDDLVGRVFHTLRGRGLFEETLVMFLVDHGDYAGQYGIIGKTGQFYDCLTRVPWIVRGPQGLLPRGRRVSGLVELVDLVPTTLDLLGLEVPQGLHGVSRLALAKGLTEEGTDAAFASTSGRDSQGPPVAYDHVWDPEMLHPLPTDPYSSGPCSHVHDAVLVRDARYKLSLYRDGGMELYDIARDPFETRNLARSREHTGIISQMLVRLVRWQMETWLPDRPQRDLPYHYRSAARDTIPPSYRLAWDAWQEQNP